MSTQGFHGREGQVEREAAISRPPHPPNGISGLAEPNSPRPTPTLATRPQVDFEIHAEETLPVAADIPKPSLQDVASASIAKRWQGDAPIEERAIQTPNSGQKQSIISHLHPSQAPSGLHPGQLLESDSRMRDYWGRGNCGSGAIAHDHPLLRGSVGSDNNLPTSNLAPELRLESSSRVHLSTMQPPYPHNPQGAAAGVDGSPFRMTRSNAQQQGGLLRMHSNPNDMGESSSRNVRMRMTLQDNNPPSADLQLGSWFNPSHQGTASGNPLPRPVRNTVYDPLYDAMGLSVDPHMRMFFAKRNQYEAEGQDKRSPDVQ